MACGETAWTLLSVLEIRATWQETCGGVGRGGGGSHHVDDGLRFDGLDIVQLVLLRDVLHTPEPTSDRTSREKSSTWKGSRTNIGYSSPQAGGNAGRGGALTPFSNHLNCTPRRYSKLNT